MTSARRSHTVTVTRARRDRDESEMLPGAIWAQGPARGGAGRGRDPMIAGSQLERAPPPQGLRWHWQAGPQAQAPRRPGESWHIEGQRPGAQPETR